MMKGIILSVTFLFGLIVSGCASLVPEIPINNPNQSQGKVSPSPENPEPKQKTLGLTVPTRPVDIHLVASANSHLLGSPQVRRELKIAHSVSLKIKQTLYKAAEAESSQGSGSMVAPQSATQRARAQSAKPGLLYRKAFDYLNLVQKRRLGQISLQQADPYIFYSSASPWINKCLDISAKQNKEIIAVFNREFERYVHGIDSLMRDNQSWYGQLDRKRYSAKYASHDKKFQQIGDIRSRNSKAIVKRVLTPSQTARWKALLGNPFDFSHLTYDTPSVPVHLD